MNTTAAKPNKYATVDPKKLSSAARLRILRDKVPTLDAPRAPRPAPREFVPPFARDRLYNPLGFRWEVILPDLSALENIFPEGKQGQARFVTQIEQAFLNGASSTMRRKYRFPCDVAGNTVIVLNERGQLRAIETVRGNGSAMITIAPYPECLTNEEMRNTFFQDWLLSSFNL